MSNLKEKKLRVKPLLDWCKNNRHPRFKGGFGISTDGYVWIFVKGYNGRNQVKLHRYLMEIKLKRKLSNKEIVHHINGDKFDNRIENLKIVSRGEHNHLHFKGKIHSEKARENYRKSALKREAKKRIRKMRL